MARPRADLRRLLAGLLLLAQGGAMADWKLLQVHDFRAGARLDEAHWSLETGFQRNRELQYYSPANIAVADGMLSLHARAERVPNAAHEPDSRDWRRRPASAAHTSASIVSRTPLHFGRVEVVARAPTGAGVWPAIWMLHESPGHYGEIDIFESVGKHPDTAFAAVHYGRTANSRRHHSAQRQVPGLDGAWHTHTLEWTPERISILLDGQPLLHFDPRSAAGPGFDPLRLPMRLRINLALGGSWGGRLDERSLPARLDIASIRLWEWQAGAATALAAPALTAAPPATPWAATSRADTVPEAEAAAEAELEPEPAPALEAGVEGPGSPASAPAATRRRWGR